MISVRALPFPAVPGRSRGALAAAFLLFLASWLWPMGLALAQDTQVIRPGSTAVTGFSGTVLPGIDRGIPAGVDPVDETFIDAEGAVLRIFDLSSLGGPAAGQLVNPPLPFEVTAGQIGQVFALTYDDGARDVAPNLYAGATSLHGIRIVTPDDDGDGRPERQRRGAAGATFMAGQFGVENGGGPGTIWKIDGATGAVSRFSDIGTNSGPGIGDVAFDGDHRQFFASDLDSGLVHRIDAAGKLVDTFDHGVAGRPADALEPVADDGSAMDIRGPAFDSEDPGTWGLTQDERRVWALAYHDGRLYYSVGEAAEIWSVGIADGGGFAGDARRELTVKADRDHAVTDIAFDGVGRMYLAQRGPVENRYDFSTFADSGKAPALRYARRAPGDGGSGAWVEDPQEYAVGFPPAHRQSAGGLDLQYDYDGQGEFGGACAATLVVTGDRLRDNPALAGRLAAGGPAAVHGIQLSPADPVGPRTEPPFGSWFVDFDGGFDDPFVKGHVGDVEVWRPCRAQKAGTEEIMEDYPPFASDDVLVLLGLPACEDAGNARARRCRERAPELKVSKRAGVRYCTPAGGCDFIIAVTNGGDAPFHGKIVLDEVTLPAGSVLASGPNPPWTCAPNASPLTCTHPATTLDPGQSVELKLGFAPPAGFTGREFRNCVVLDGRDNDRKAFGRTHEDRACARIPVCRRGDNDRACRPPPERKVDLLLKKRPRTAACTADGVCTFVIDVINAGSGTYSGPLTVLDSFADAPASSTFGPSPPWTCGPAGPGTFRCDNPGVVLVPGGAVSIGVRAVMPEGYGKASVGNCAEVGAIAGEASLANNKACAAARFGTPAQDRPRLRVEKTGDAECRAGQPCSFEITIANDGDTPFSAPMRIGDAIGIDGKGRLEGVAVKEIAPPLGCAAAPSALPLSCVADLSIGAHASRKHKVVVVIPEDAGPSGTGGRVGGQNCVGVVSPDTPVVGGAGAAGGGGRDGKAYACHPFTIVRETKKACAKGFVKNDAGDCVCPAGTRVRGGQCAADPKPQPPPPPKRDDPKQCVLLKGQVRTRSGDCVCPRGTELKGRRCVRSVQECDILGQVHNRRGQCVCPRGTDLVRGACRKPQAQHCPEGTVRKGGRCIEVRRQCPEGMIGEYPDCFRKRRGPRIEIDPADLLDLLPRHHRPRGERQRYPQGETGQPRRRRPPQSGDGF